MDSRLNCIFSTEQGTCSAVKPEHSFPLQHTIPQLFKETKLFKYKIEYFIVWLYFLLYFVEALDRLLFGQNNTQVYIPYLSVICHKPSYQHSLLSLSRW